jgi:hypothetical protein
MPSEPIKIPDEVVEAAVSAYNYASSDCYTTQEQDMRAAIVAALNAWPGTNHFPNMPRGVTVQNPFIILPLPQGGRDG